MRALHTFLVAALAASTAGGCAKDRAGASGAEADVKRLARTHGLTLRDTVCEDVGAAGERPRSVACVTELDPSQVKALTDGLSMAQSSRPAGPPRGCWAKADAMGATSVLEARGAQTSAAGFERVRIHSQAAVGRACLELEYPPR